MKRDQVHVAAGRGPKQQNRPGTDTSPIQAIQQPEASCGPVVDGSRWRWRWVPVMFRVLPPASPSRFSFLMLEELMYPVPVISGCSTSRRRRPRPHATLWMPSYATPSSVDRRKRLPRAHSRFRRPPSSRRGEALWEQVEAGSGSLGAASSESAAGCGRLRACGC